MPAEGSRNQSRPITSLRFLQPQPTASTSASERVQTTARNQRHQTSPAPTSNLSAGSLSDGFAGVKGLPKQPQIEPATPSVGNPSRLKPMSALFAPVLQRTKSATIKKIADPFQQQPATTTPTPTTIRPTPRRPKRLLASENEVEQWEREADRVDRLRRAKTPRTTGDGNDEMAAAAAIEDNGAGGDTETKQGPLPTREEEEEEEEKEPAAAILRPITFLHPSRPANDRATTKITTTKPIPPARKPDKSPVAAAVYDLSSLAPTVSKRPKIETSDPRPPPPPQKPKLPPGPGAPRPVALSKLTSAVFVPGNETTKKKKREPPQAALSAFRPPPLTLAVSATGGNGMDDGEEGQQQVEVEEWSPKKRKGGYLASGMAARATNLLSAARTEQTLWLHDFSRRLAAVASAPSSNGRATTATTRLAAELGPDLRLKVLQVLSFGNDEADSFMTSDRRRERRTTLAVCRLVLVREHRPAELGVADPTSSTGEPTTRETQGLVLFSLHDHHLGGTSTSSVPLPSPKKRPRPDSDPSSSSSSSSSTARTLAVPAIPPDLRLIRPGVEVWVWEPFHEVALLGAEDVRFDDEQTPTSARVFAGEEEERGTPVPVGDVSVRWQNGGGGAADDHGEAELSIDGGSEAVAKKGLVCGRFAILT